MRIIHNALGIARIKGYRAGLRNYRNALKSVIAAFLDEFAALLLLWRAKLLRK